MMSLLRVFWLWLLFLTTHPLWALDTKDLQRPPIKEWQQQLDDAEAQLKTGDLDDEDAVALRDHLLLLDSRLREMRDRALERAELIGHDLDALGPAPKDGEAPEAPRLLSRRKALQDQMAAQDAGAKEGDLLLSRLSRVLSEIKSLRRDRLTARILTRSFGTLDPLNWQRTVPEWREFADAVLRPLKHAREGGMGLSPGQQVGGCLALLALMILRWRLAARVWARRPVGAASVLQKLFDAARYFGLSLVFPLGLLGLGMLAGTALAQDLGPLIDDLVLVVVGFLLSRAIMRTLLRPVDARMRLLDLSDPAASVLDLGATALLGLLAWDQLLATWFIREDVSPELLATEQVVFCLLITLPLWGLLSASLWRPPLKGWGVRVLQWGLRGLTLAIPLATLSGYVALARLLATHGVWTLGLVFFVGAMIGIGEQAVAAFMLPQARLGQGLRGSMGLTDEDTEMLVFWWRAVFRLLLLFLGLGGLLLLWSGDTKDLLLLCMEFLNGFRIGHISIQPTAILSGIVLFAVFLMTTRLIQRSLDLRIFPRTRLDVGARHSIRSAVGYLGFSLAALLGVSVMGVDLSNLAIIAGALSVGIGFGLQNIVNNFVSGLILLIERPIKTGDWVMVGEYQGYVKNISVRATEITTFDRASVFIPNSSLISGAVLNRTHADRLGRVMLPLRVDPLVDPERVRRILLDMAAAIPEIKQTPSPLVFFTALDETMLSLELVALVRDVEGVKEVTSQLLVEIHRRFQREGIGYRAAPDKGVSVTLQEDQLKDVLQSLKR